MADGTSAAAETVAVANAYLATPRYECTYGSTLLSGTERARHPVRGIQPGEHGEQGLNLTIMYTPAPTSSACLFFTSLICRNC